LHPENHPLSFPTLPPPLSTLQAREVLKWRTDKPDEAYKIWEALADVNEDIQGNLNELWGLAEVEPSLSPSLLLPPLSLPLDLCFA
jgi:hypothetical protein